MLAWMMSGRNCVTCMFCRSGLGMVLAPPLAAGPPRRHSQQAAGPVPLTYPSALLNDIAQARITLPIYLFHLESPSPR